MMKYTAKKSSDPRGTYILKALDQHMLNGDAYVLFDEAYEICCRDRKVTFKSFLDDLMYLIKSGALHREGTRLYLAKTYRYEEAASEYLARILTNNHLGKPDIPETLEVGEIRLTGEQRSAVSMALEYRISMILGGAGSGKTTLIKAIVSCSNEKYNFVLAAPTGKAARNLTIRTGMEARTVHSALGMRPNEDFLKPVKWEVTRLVIIDEASMMTLEMLAGLLTRMEKNCHLVLLGDPNQLLSVGGGNVIPDFMDLGVPYTLLETNHRQVDGSKALRHNVTEFGNLHSVAQLLFDESFAFMQMDDDAVEDQLVADAVRAYSAGESVQVLSPYNSCTKLSADKLSREIRERVNPAAPGKLELSTRYHTFRDGDRVIITQNDRDRDCNNGDVGILHITDVTYEDHPAYHVQLSDGRRPQWITRDGLYHMKLAYALTVHKSQGSEYDKILFPVSNNAMNMMYRNLFYTAISRGKKQIVLYGSKAAMSAAMQREADERRTMLVVKTRNKQTMCA